MIRWLLFVLVLACDVALSHALTARADGVQLAFFGGVFALITAAFAWLADKAVTIAVTVAQVAVMIGQAIGHFAVLTAHVFARVFGFLRSFWSGVLRPFITWSWDQIERFSGWLRRTLAPVIKFLQDIRTEVQKIYDKWLRPIFDTIDATRRILQVLATLRVPFARELDRKLAELESFLMRPILELYRLLNTAMDWINRIVTLNGLLQRLTLLKSLLEYERDNWNVWWESVRRRQGERPTLPPDARPARTAATAAAAVEAYALRHEGPDVGFIDEHASDLRLRLLRGRAPLL